MHSHARHWPKPLWTLGIIVVLTVVYFVAPMPFEKPYIDPGFAVVLILILPLFYILLVAGLVMRHDERMRERAMLGDTAGMPLARKQPARLIDGDVARKPLELTWNLQGKTGAIATSDEGLVLRRPRKQDVHLAWAEIRLFEVGFIYQGKDIESLPGYCVYGGNGQYIEWPGQLVSLKPKLDQGPSLEEYRQRQAALLSLVAARTGLSLRTLIPERATTGNIELPTVRMARRVNRALGALFFVLAVATSLIAGVLSLTFPLTRTLAFNIYVALVAFILGVFLLRRTIRVVRLFIRSAEPPIPVMLPPVPIHLNETAPVTVVLDEPLHRVQRLGLLLLGVLLVGVIVPLRFSRFDFPRSYYVDQSITNIYGDLRLVVLSGIMIGVFFIVLAILPSLRHAVGPRADEIGLYEGRGKAQRFISWRGIDLFIAIVSPGGLMSFMVIGNGLRMEWPADARWAQPPVGATDAAAGAQFAAIVAQRSGVQPITQWA
jgi:hypothetical protein